MRFVLAMVGVMGVCGMAWAQDAQGDAQGELPDLLRMADGRAVDTSEMWREQRRPELVKLLGEHVYGHTAVGRPERLEFETTRVDRQAMGGAATLKQVDIKFAGPAGSGKIGLILFTPNAQADAARQRPPVLLFICNRGRDNIDPTRERKSAFWPAEAIVARGYAAATFHNSDVAIDKTEGLQSGVFAAFAAPADRGADDWGVIGAWAWGASRVLDYLETDADVDASRVAVIGHSRGGKTSLWAGAQDERFAMAIANGSGAAGAALARGHRGERIRDSVQRFGYWYCRNYATYADREQAMPVDQHMLLAAMAPRPVYVSSAVEDKWADPLNEFASCVAAQPAWRLHGLPGLESQEMPEAGRPLHGGTIGYHIREGVHNLTEYDWQQFMDFADRHLGKQ